MNVEQFERFGLDRTKSRDDIMALLFCKGLPGLPRLLEDGDFKGTAVIGKIVAPVHQINLLIIFTLLNNIDRKKSNIELEQSIEEDWSMGQIEKANKGVEQMLAQEMEDGGNNAPMEKVIDNRVKSGITEGLKPMQAELRQLKQQVRAKGTGGGKGKLFETRYNGQKQSVRFLDSSKEKDPPCDQRMQNQIAEEKEKGSKKHKSGPSQNRGRKPAFAVS